VRATGVTEATYYRWRSEFGGLKLDQVKRLKALEQENGWLRRAVADLTLEGYIWSDNGPEFIATAVKGWINGVGARTAFIEPGSPWEIPSTGTPEKFARKVGSPRAHA
jgi:hypothetical protein